MISQSQYSQKINAVLSEAGYLNTNYRLESYSEARPFAVPLPPPATKPFIGDCSSTVNLVRYWGAGDGMDTHGPGADRQSNTATLWLSRRGFPVNGLGHARSCDLVFYGNPVQAGPNAHVLMLTTKNKDGSWNCISMSSGAEPQPHSFNPIYEGSPIVGIRRYPFRAS